MLKQCTICTQFKELSLFEFRKDTKKYRNHCKECVGIKNAKYRDNNKEKLALLNKIWRMEHREEQNKKHKIYYEKTKEKQSENKKAHHRKFPWKNLLTNIKSRCENPKNKSFKDYGLRGIKCLITLKELEYLWNRDNAWLLEKPSIDRKDNDGNYEIDNCQFIEMEVNRIKDRKVPVVQLDLENNVIKYWDSMINASRELNIVISGISACCTNRYTKSGGFKWKYAIN